jgi:hypothetical protein
MTYPPLAHLPKSITRQRSEQNGKSSLPASTIALQFGQRNIFNLFAIPSSQNQCQSQH